MPFRSDLSNSALVNNALEPTRSNEVIHSEFTYINSPVPCEEKKLKAKDQNPDLKKATILLVDDNDLVLETLRSFLIEENYCVLAATSGDQGLELFSKHSDAIGAAIVDDCMPGMSGVDLLKHIHKIKPTVKAILTSGYYGDDYRGPTLDKKWATFLHKPYEISSLLKMLKEMFQTSSS